MQKIDLRKEWKHLYRPSAKKVELVDVPEMNFLMIDGHGDPNTSQEFADAIEALFGVSYTAKFMVKKGDAAIDYSVMPLEGLWWVENMAEFSIERKQDWDWTLMIMQPEYAPKELLKAAMEEVQKKKNPPALSKLRLESYHEGPAAQTMHIGPFADEGPTIQKVHQFIGDSDYHLQGRHHEIYLSDIRRAAPEKLKTIIRQPIKKN
jgi:hypothetical protein